MGNRLNEHDFWYAVHNTEIVTMPKKRLETFGATILNYHMVSELMDDVEHVRVREGRVHAFKPQIITPSPEMTESILEGFGPEAEEYAGWLRDHKILALRYDFRIRKEEFSEHLLSDNITTVLDRVTEEVRQKNDPFSAVIRGVDEPWDVCIVKLCADVMTDSVGGNVRDMRRKGMLGQREGIPNHVRMEIDDAFRAARLDRSRISDLSSKLENLGLFEQYQDRFFALVKASK